MPLRLLYHLILVSIPNGLALVFNIKEYAYQGKSVKYIRHVARKCTSIMVDYHDISDVEYFFSAICANILARRSSGTIYDTQAFSWEKKKYFRNHVAYMFTTYNEIWRGLTLGEE